VSHRTRVAPGPKCILSKG